MTFSSTATDALVLQCRHMNSHVTVVDHPLVASALTILRNKATAPDEFRRKMHEVSVLLLFEASRFWKLRQSPCKRRYEPIR